MHQPLFARLVGLYERQLYALFRGPLLEMLAHPELTDVPEFRQSAWQVAAKMATSVATQNAKSWREAAFRGSGGRRVYEALQREIREKNLQPELNTIARRNARLITSLPRDVAEHIAKFAGRQHQAGRRTAEIEAEIRKLAPRLTANRIRLIARTEISRSETDLTRARSENIGISWYQWASAMDQRVRPSHRNMNMVLVAWNDPPDPEKLIGVKSNAGSYAAGCTYNCRCVSLPIADLSEITWPARVYRQGKIQSMNRGKFAKLYEWEMAA